MADTNPYAAAGDAFFSNYDNVANKETALRQSMIRGSEMNPDEAAKALPVAEKNQLPLDMAARNLPELTKNFNVDGLDYAGMLKDYPKLSNFLTNPDNAALSHDDVSALQKVSSFFSTTNNFLDVSVPHAIRDMAKSIPSGVLSGTGGAFSGIGAATTRGAEYLSTGNAAGKLLGEGVGSLAEGMDWIGSQYKKAGEILKPAENSTGNQVGETLGQFLPWIAANLATGGEASMPYLFGVSGAGSKLEQEKQDVVGPNGPLSTYGTVKGDLAAGLYGAVNAVLGSKTFGAITHGMSPAVEKNVLLPIVGSLNKVGIPVGGTAEQWITKALDVAYRGVVGGGQMAGIQLAGNATDKFLLGHTDKDMTEGVAPQFGLAGAASAILGTMFHVVAKTPTMFDAARAQSAKDYFDKSREVLGESNLMKRSPEKMNELINSQTGGTDVHVNADALNTFYQSLSDADRSKLDEKMPDLNKDIRDGMTTKADIPINQADFHTYIQPADVDGHLDEWTKLVPEHLSEGDMKAHDQFMQALFDTVEENNRSLGNRDAQDTQSSIYDQLIRFTGAGRTPSAMVDAAKMISENPAKFYDAMMARTGNRGDVADVLNRLIRDVQIKRMLPNMEPYMVKGEMDLRLDDLRNLGTEAAKKSERGVTPRKQKIPTPIMDYIGKLGGVRRGSPIAKEMAALGINKTDHPQVFNKFTPPDANQRGLGGIASPEMDATKYGLKGLDTIVASELENATGIHPKMAENSGHVDTNWLLDQLRAESFKDSHMTDKDQEREDLSQMLDYLNLDVHKNSNIYIKRAIEAARAEQQKALEMNGSETHRTFFQQEKPMPDPNAYLADKGMTKVVLGDATEYDPLTGLHYVAPEDARASVFDKLAAEQKSNDISWHSEKIAVKIDGKNVKVEAGKMAKNLSQRLNALSKLRDCLG